MEKKTIVARVEVLPGKEEAFKKVAQGVIEGTRKEAGNLSYNLYQNTSVPTMFLFSEEYKDEAAMDTLISLFQDFCCRYQGLTGKGHGN